MGVYSNKKIAEMRLCKNQHVDAELGVPNSMVRSSASRHASCVVVVRDVFHSPALPQALNILTKADVGYIVSKSCLEIN